MLIPFLIISGKQHLCILSMSPDPASIEHTPSFFTLYSRGHPCSAKLSSCLICLTCDIWELPALVPLGGDAYKVASTDGPQHLQKCFSRGLYLLIPWTAWSLFSSCPGLKFCCRFLIVNRDFKLSGFVIAVAMMASVSSSFMRLSLLTSSRSKKASFWVGSLRTFSTKLSRFSGIFCPRLYLLCDASSWFLGSWSPP